MIKRERERFLKKNTNELKVWVVLAESGEGDVGDEVEVGAADLEE